MTLLGAAWCQVIDEVRCKVYERDVSVVILDFSHVPAIDALPPNPNFLKPEPELELHCAPRGGQRRLRHGGPGAGPPFQL